MKSLNSIKSQISLLELNRDIVLESWLELEIVKETLVVAEIKDAKEYIDAIFSSIINIVKWQSHITDSPKSIEFLKILKDSGVKSVEIMMLYQNLKNSIYDFLYLEGVSSKVILDELNYLFDSIFKDISQNYIEINSDSFSVDRNLKLLNEYKKAVDESNIVSKTDSKGRITYINSQFCRISGYDKSELIGKPHSIVRHPLMPRQVFKDLWDRIKSKKIWKGIIKNLKKDGGTYIVNTTIIPILDNYGDILEYIAIRHDITEFEEAKEQLRTLNTSMRRKVNELYDIASNLEFEAHTDELTGIYNRKKFYEFLNMDFQKVLISDFKLSLIVMDIDRFKSINDTFGHQTGDSVLREVAQIVSNSIKRSDIFARWGGEEFVVLTPNTSIDGAFKLAENIRENLEIHIFTDIGYLTSSFGVTEAKREDSIDKFIDRADRALYRAKKSGRNRVEKL